MTARQITLEALDEDLPQITKAFVVASKYFTRAGNLERAARFRSYADQVRRSYHEEH